MEKNFWKGKNVLVTGHTGFKGSWLSIWLNKLGANVTGFSIDSNCEFNNYNLCKVRNFIDDNRGDIRKIEDLRNIFVKKEFDIVFHLAAQALVSEGYKEPIKTYTSNLNGTLNLLEVIKEQDQKMIIVLITTDKVYENKESIWGYRENDALGGYDPYSSSKACCEILINSYTKSYFNNKDYKNHKKAISSVRAGNVIGGGDWAKDRIIPDIIRALESNKEIVIKNPNSIRPWQHVLEPICGYIMLAEEMWNNPDKYSGAWNFGPNIEKLNTVLDIVNKINKISNNKLKVKVIKNEKFHETNILVLDITKSKLILKWKPVLSLDETLNLTYEWYDKYKNNNVLDICNNQIDYYVKKVEKKNE